MINKKAFTIVIAVLIAGLIIGSFFDYQISTFLVQKNNGLAIFFAAFGELPGYAVLSFFSGFTFILGLKHYRKVWGGWVLMGSAVIGVGCAAFFQGKAIFSINAYNMEEKTLFPGLLVGTGLMVLPVLAGLFFGNKAHNKELWRIAFFSLVAIGISIGLVTIVKHIPDRPRYRLVVSNPDVDFYPWWKICKEKDALIQTYGISKEDFKSFPSGHVGITSAMFVSVYIPMLLEMKKPEMWKRIFFYVTCAYILFLAYTRILAGAHYLSDVAAGGIISVSIYLGLIFFLDKYAKKIEEEQTKSLSE